MTREQAINYLISSGFTHEQIGEVVRALTYEPTTKNDPKFCPDRKAKTAHMETILHCIENECVAYKDGKCLKYNSDQEPTTKNNLSVDEVTALAEWTEKLTKASEDAYNKGFADGMKAQAEHESLCKEEREISKEKAIEILKADSISSYSVEDILSARNMAIKALEQEPKTGHWIEHSDDSGKWYECDQCHSDWVSAVNFCPDCGADMREVEE